MRSRFRSLTVVIVGSGLLSAGSALGAAPATPQQSQEGQMNQAAIPGYTHGSASLQTSPVGLDELATLRQTVLLSDEDIASLRASGEVLAPQIEDILDVWYGFVGANPHLLASFSDANGTPDPAYLEAVRGRFGQWILDTSAARFDQQWLDYQHEIGLRHHRTKKNVTDGASAVPHIPFRYLTALYYPITATLRPFLERGDHTPEQVDAMHEAWRKSVLLQLILWSQPYVVAGDF